MAGTTSGLGEGRGVRPRAVHGGRRGYFVFILSFPVRAFSSFSGEGSAAESQLTAGAFPRREAKEIRTQPR